MGKSFTQEETLYSHDEFSIAYGTWTVDGVEEKVLACRWSNYPMSKYGKPTWLVLPTDLNISFLYALLYQYKGVDKEALERVMTRTSKL